MTRAWILALLCLPACQPAPPDTVSQSSLASHDIRSGYEFLQAETRALQDDDFSNPGYLWVDKGARLYSEPVSNGGPSCAGCHEGSGSKLAGVAAKYPAYDAQSGTLLNLEARINLCRTVHQQAPALEYESENLLALTGYIASLSRGIPISVEASGPAAPYYEIGQRYFFQRKGQLNLACSQCHNENWGKRLRGDTVSQGHGNAFPAYRLEWQSFGSLQRRLRDCDAGIGAEPLEYGSEVYTAVELYLASRANGLPLESPGVRR